MEKIGEKHAFFEKRKCGSRKVLRFMRSLLYALAVLSLPLRGAWIEMLLCLGVLVLPMSRSPCGERGLKFTLLCLHSRMLIVAPPAGSVD